MSTNYKPPWYMVLFLFHRGFVEIYYNYIPHSVIESNVSMMIILSKYSMHDTVVQFEDMKKIKIKESIKSE